MQSTSISTVFYHSQSTPSWEACTRFRLESRLCWWAFKICWKYFLFALSACEAGATLLIELIQVWLVGIEQKLRSSIHPYVGCILASLSKYCWYTTTIQAGTPLWEVEVAVTSLCILLQVRSSWLPHSTYLYFEFHLLLCCVTQAKRPQQGNVPGKIWSDLLTAKRCKMWSRFWSQDHC